MLFIYSSIVVLLRKSFVIKAGTQNFCSALKLATRISFMNMMISIFNGVDLAFFLSWFKTVRRSIFTIVIKVLKKADSVDPVHVSLNVSSVITETFATESFADILHYSPNKFKDACIACHLSLSLTSWCRLKYMYVVKPFYYALPIGL